MKRCALQHDFAFAHFTSAPLPRGLRGSADMPSLERLPLELAHGALGVELLAEEDLQL